jgi:predicted phage terminase large subunit-like protein
MGEALCAERYSVPELLSIQQVIGRDFFGLYQQRPQARAGGMFKIHWLPLVEAIPARAARLRWWDRASTMDGGDYTAGVLLAYADGLWFVEDVVRGQWSSGERDRIIRAVAESDRLRYGHVEYFSEQEPGSAGKDKAEDFVKLLAGFSADAIPSSGSKTSRADALSKQAEWNNVRVLRASWSSAFISECCDFPSGTHDDQIDAAASAFNRLAATVGPASAKVAERKTPHAQGRGSSWDVHRQTVKR